MKPQTAAILADPHPRCHIVYPCGDDEQIVDAVCVYAAHGLKNREGVVLIATKAHRDAIVLRLTAEGYDMERLEHSRQVAFFDAETLLSKLLARGIPNPTVFRDTVGSLIATAKLVSPTRRVRLFGEMVSLLCGKDLPATLRLEELWNELIQAYSVPLLCTYSLGTLAGSMLPQQLIGAHSHCLSA